MPVCAALGDQAGDFGQLPGADDQVDVGSPLEDQLLVLLGHAAHYADHLLRPAFFAVPQTAQLAVDLVLRVLADAAGVEEDRVGFMDVAGELVTLPPQGGHNQLAVELVHLAADRLDVKLTIVVHFAAGWAACVRVGVDASIARTMPLTGSD